MNLDDRCLVRDLQSVADLAGVPYAARVLYDVYSRAGQEPIEKMNYLLEHMLEFYRGPGCPGK